MNKLILFLLLATPVAAQQLPFKPPPTVRVHLTDGVKKWYEPLPVEHRTADHRWLASVGVSALLTVADAENSLYALRLSGATEANPLLGSHPSRLRYYSILAPVAVGSGYLSWKYKREDEALKSAGIQGHKYIKWWLPNVMNSGVHILGLAVTIASAHR